MRARALGTGFLDSATWKLNAKMATSLVFGSVALFASGKAQAADLPVKAKAVEYVRICSLYGAGFFYIPGTDTCIKLGGYLRADVTYMYGPAVRCKGISSRRWLAVLH